MTARFATAFSATILLIGSSMFVGCSMDGKSSDESAAAILGESSNTPPLSTASFTDETDQEAEQGEGESKKLENKDEKKETITIKTNLGEMEIELFEKEAPLSSKNFLAYAKEGHYDGTIFHRVMKTFMIQGGGFTEDLKKKPTKSPIKNESTNGLKNAKYTIAMARTGDPHSATNQFYINTVDNPGLDRANAQDGYGYAVFGRVVAGTDVVDKIAAVPTKSVSRSMTDLPRETVVIEKVTVPK